MKNKIITNTSADWIEVTDNPLGYKGITIKAVGYPNQTTTHLKIDNVIDLYLFLKDVLKDNNIDIKL